MAGARLEADLWLNEAMTPWDVYAHGVTRVLAQRRTAHQEMAVVETGAYGRALVLDGKWQSSTGDEFLYHEPLVQPACVLHGAPRRALVLGGGEGAALRELLRWRSVERAVMVDLDGEVVEACREHLPSLHAGAFDDPRVELRIGDARAFVEEARAPGGERFDVVISDLSDPIEGGPAAALFTRELFEAMRALLAEGGLLALQAGGQAPPELGVHARLVSTLRRVFPEVAVYASFVPTWAAPMGFALCGERPLPERPDPGAVDRLLAEGTSGGLRMFDGRTLLGMLQLPLHVREAIRTETGVYTLADPPRAFGAGVGERGEGA